ncbi:ACP S-malonyltransferase [Treponema sp. Marseille-Q3903]|uniref:ACP S-malonyltransferase n=1 Tax=Treponema sp. Marseille-Q3903 TaxID=2766703 RepID=UPI0016521F90|nr:ACP S-malonyltransferase [Treponema sp. Marseille-Q3903]MBC6714021.1 ACP S-malonyltransferase [Treponema sp. Marseille-Q3903]
MKKYAFLFPGQGAQVPGMIKDICDAYPEARKVVDEVSKITGVNMAELLWESDAAVLSRSDNSQLAITTASLAVIKVLESKGIKPSAVMGFSLGEFPALYAAGVLSFEDVIKVVRKRGQIMQATCEKIAKENEGHAPGMTAVIGLSPEQVTAITKDIKDAYPANLNSPVQTVVSGTADALTELEAKAKEAGARRALRLAVAGPFHSPLMQEAADNFEKALADFTFNNPDKILFSNVTGKQAKDAAEIKKNAVLHLTNPVRWTDEEKVLNDLIADDKDNEWELIEPGVGSVLSGLWAKSGYGEEIKCVSVNSAETLANY